MSEETRSMLVLNYDSKTTEFLKSVFSESCAVTSAQNLAEVSEKAGDGFDVVLTGYAVPAFSGEKITSYLGDVQKAFDDTASDLRENTRADETLLKEREREQADILAFLKEHVGKAEQEKALVKQEMQAVVEKSENYLKEKLEAEKTAAAAVEAQNKADENAAAALKSQQAAETETEKALKDRAEAIKEKEAAVAARDVAEKNEKAAVESQSAAETTMNEKIEAEARIAKLHEEDTARIEQLTGDLNGLREELTQSEASRAAAETAMNEKIEAEASIAKLHEEDTARIEQLTGDLNRLREELTQSKTLAEQTLAEKASTEEKLIKLQENWTRYVEGA